jgi:hypothetical protein
LETQSLKLPKQQQGICSVRTFAKIDLSGAAGNYGHSFNVQQYITLLLPEKQLYRLLASELPIAVAIASANLNLLIIPPALLLFPTPSYHL